MVPAYQEGEDSSWADNFYYDDAGRLRFVLMTSYAANGTREQHRAYSMKAAVSSTMVAGSSRERDTLALQSKTLRNWGTGVQNRILRKKRKDAKR